MRKRPKRDRRQRKPGELSVDIPAVAQDYVAYRTDNPYLVEYDGMEAPEGHKTLEEARATAQARIAEGKQDVHIWGP